MQEVEFTVGREIKVKYLRLSFEIAESHIKPTFA